MARRLLDTLAKPDSVSGQGGLFVAPMRTEPSVREVVLDVVRPRERHEHVRAQEPGQTSSSASRTMSGVSGGASGPTSKTGKPSGPAAWPEASARGMRRCSLRALWPCS